MYENVNQILLIENHLLLQLNSNILLYIPQHSQKLYTIVGKKKKKAII